jgi:hypothetical protein
MATSVRAALAEAGLPRNDVYVGRVCAALAAAGMRPARVCAAAGGEDRVHAGSARSARAAVAGEDAEFAACERDAVTAAVAALAGAIKAAR